MRIAFFGDVVGKAGREGLCDALPGLRYDLRQQGAGYCSLLRKAG